MKNIIQVDFEEEAVEFLASLSQSTRDKFLIYIDHTSHGKKGRWFSKMKGESNLYEFRVEADNTWYRLFAYFSEDQKSLLICINGFQKKQNKTPVKEIEKALKLKKKYGGGS